MRGITQIQERQPKFSPATHNCICFRCKKRIEEPTTSLSRAKVGMCQPCAQAAIDRWFDMNPGGTYALQ